MVLFSILQVSLQLVEPLNATQKPGPKKRSLAIHRNEKPKTDVIIAPRLTSGKVIAQARETMVPRIEEMPKMTSKNRGSIVFLGDASPSMGEVLNHGKFNGTLAEFVKDALKNTMAEIVEASKSDDGGLKHNADIAAFSYYHSVDNGGNRSTLVDPVLPTMPVGGSPLDLARALNPSEVATESIKFEHSSEGATPMKYALGKMVEHYKEWAINTPRHSRRGKDLARLFSLVHLSDGESKDGNPHESIKALAKEVKDNGDELLVTNVHVSARVNKELLFPTYEEVKALNDPYALSMYEMSSPMPEDVAKTLDDGIIANWQERRMFCLNVSDLEHLVEALKAASSTVLALPSS